MFSARATIEARRCNYARC